MLYIHETPIHFGAIMLLCIIFLVFALIGIIGSLRGRSPSSGFGGFLAVVFGFLTFMSLAASIYNLPAVATAVQLLPYYLGAYTFVGLHAFCLVFYCLDFEWFKKRMWAVYLPILGTLSWLTLLWFLATPVTVQTVSDGVLTYLAMPFYFILYSGLLAFFYMFLVPFLVLYRLAKEREGAAKMWTWIGWLGIFLWFIAALLMALVQFIAPFMLYTFILAAIAWIIIFIAWLLVEFKS
ncbi:MAG: hypothetical protein ACFE89_04715 [Candidatus Hodarchaeota archaeon]